MATHRRILTFYFFLLLLELYQLYNEEYEHWCENSASKTSDNVELVTLINSYKVKQDDDGECGYEYIVMNGFSKDSIYKIRSLKRHSG